ncbi:MAG: hypothetical protein U9N61_00800 [Euryarchaeota archaeon]|nr:hypothetical protein [Euryarchaeota archaeon]
MDYLKSVSGNKKQAAKPSFLCSFQSKVKKFRNARGSWGDLDIEDIYMKFNEDVRRWTLEESV